MLRALLVALRWLLALPSVIWQDLKAAGAEAKVSDQPDLRSCVHCGTRRYEHVVIFGAEWMDPVVLCPTSVFKARGEEGVHDGTVA